MTRGPMIAANGEVVYTTHQIASLLAVSPRSVAAWCDSGELDHYRMPGFKDRRITRRALLAFAKTHGLPAELIRPVNRAVCVGAVPGDLKAALDRMGFAVESRDGALGAGISLGQGAPSCVIVDLGIGRIDANAIAIEANGFGAVAVAMTADPVAADTPNFRRTYTTGERQDQVAVAIARMVQAAERDRARGANA